MNKEIFTNHFKKGLGSVILFMKKNTTNYKYEEIIYNFAVHNYDFDPQCEESKAQYIWEAISYSGVAEKLQRRILNTLDKLVNGYDIEQVYELAVYFYKNGNMDCLEVLKKNFKFNNDWNCFIGAEEIIDIAGEEGLLFVMSRISIHLLQDKEYDGEDYTLEYAFEIIGKERVIELLKPLMQLNSKFKTYVIKDNTYTRRPKQPKSESYFDINKKLLEVSSYELRRWGIYASNYDLELAAKDLLCEIKEERILKLLYIFGHRKFPNDITKILTFLESCNEDLSSNAVYLLKDFHDDRIREKAINLIKNKDNWYDYLSLLVNNYDYSDCKLIVSLLDRNYSDDILHSIQLDIIKMLEIKCNSKCKELLEIMYYLGPCSICREKLVRIMITNKLVDDKILHELEYDSNQEIRKLAVNIE